MRVLVTGGSGSGKSAFAERLAAGLAPTRTYVATMSPVGSEAKARIERHRRQRAGLGFVTLECADGSLPAVCDPQGVVLLDDLGNLAANALFLPDGTMADSRQVLERLEQEVAALTQGFSHAVVVTNEVGSEGSSPYDGTQAWVRLMGALSCRLAAAFDVVVEIVCGVPCVAKGALP